MADATPDPQGLIRLARQTLSSSERRKKYRRIDFLDQSFWYPSQKAFFMAGSSGVHQRLIYGGNQSGKTLSAAFEVALHMTGDYPYWWTGKRFDKPVRVWAVGESGQLVRDTLQKKLCGDDEFGTGMIPLESFGKKPVMVPGGTGAIDTMFVTHQTDGVADGTSSLTFKSFEMRREKLQGESVDLIWIDERPSEDIYSELLARTSATDGHLIVSFTPVGEGAAAGVTYKFLSEPSSDRAVFRIPSSEVKHISEARREELSSGYAEHEREARIEGTPQLGAGPIFPVELLPAISKSFNPDTDIPTYARWCVGIDFGYGHPFAAALIAWAHDTGHIWVVDSFRMERSSALYHVQRIHSMARGLRIPIAWPHDGAQHDKGSGLPLSHQYKNFGANMMMHHAVNHGTKTNAVEPALEEIRGMMYGGKLTIAPHNGELLEELRNYHRDEDFKIVKQRDDLVSAMRYAIMMRRHGKALADCDGIGYGNYPMAGPRQSLGSRQELARGVDFDVFSRQ
ncbi:terminase family protein [Bradyrhizobium sp. NBAIM08]|uniref:terminase large subunit domain-containing protein n=1 Tax=Bradyrhizobium sp. NBAIM08 TaxID=2793815 RepID=UPI001CD2F919|nr:terminase family protein [Bradyrhizobium sp. NBAIM08]MCA1474769.1 DNA packaging protein [Bradyrhizobium sp. NBAIM08]